MSTISDLDRMSEAEDFSEEVSSERHRFSPTVSTTSNNILQPLRAPSTNDNNIISHLNMTSPLERLPTELKIMIIAYILPQNLSFEFKPMWACDARTGWLSAPSAEIRDIKSTPNIYVVKTVVTPTPWIKEVRSRLQTYTTLIRVKPLASEVRGFFHDNNEIRLFWPQDLDVPLISGPFGPLCRLQTARDIRNLRVGVNIYKRRLHSFRSLQGRLELLVTELTKDANGQDLGSLLKCLRIDVIQIGQSEDGPEDEWEEIRVRFRGYNIGDDTKHVKAFMFVLEVLVPLRSVERHRNVTVRGVPKWFASCLELYLSGKGGKVEEWDWPKISISTIRHFTNRPLEREVLVTRRKWNQPKYDWRGFAARNEIKVPANVGRFWEVDK